MADNMASAAYRERRRTRIFPIPIRTQDPSDNSPSGRPPVVNFSSPLIQKDRNRDRSLPRSSASSSYGRETTDSEDINMANWTPTAPSSAVTSDTNKHRSVDLLKAAWNVSTASTLSPYLSGHQGDHSSWDPTNTQGIPLPPKRYVGDEKAPEIPSDWPGIEDGLLTSVTLRDGRVAERDCASGHWKWRPDSVGSRMSGQTLNEKAYAKLTALEAEREPMPKLPFDLQTPRSQTPTPPVAPAPPASVFASTSTPHEIAFIVIVCLAQFLALAGLSQTVAPLPIIGNNFGITDPGTLSWYTAAFSLTVGTFILPAGMLFSESLALPRLTRHRPSGRHAGTQTNLRDRMAMVRRLVSNHRLQFQIRLRRLYNLSSLSRHGSSLFGAQRHGTNRHHLSHGQEAKHHLCSIRQHGPNRFRRRLGLLIPPRRNSL